MKSLSQVNCLIGLHEEFCARYSTTANLQIYLVSNIEESSRPYNQLPPPFGPPPFLNELSRASSDPSSRTQVYLLPGPNLRRHATDSPTRLDVGKKFPSEAQLVCYVSKLATRRSGLSR
jgi:hypothetical protein